MQTRDKKCLPTFKIAVFVASILGFSQLLAIGLGISKQRVAGYQATENSAKGVDVVVLNNIVNTEKSITPEVEDVKVRTANEILDRIIPNHKKIANAYAEKSKSNSLSASGVVDAGKVTISASQTSDLNYIISHPKVESLIKQAHSSYLTGDMVKAITLIGEASSIDPAEPAVIDLEAQIAEDIGALDKARQLYLKIYQLGISSGSYYRRAAYKLEKGVGAKLGDWSDLMFGTLNIERSEGGKQAVITIPIFSKEGEVIIPELVEIQVNLYDVVNGEKILPAAKNAKIESSWLDSVRNWEDSGKESIRIHYEIPIVDEVEQYLYGNRTYYGQVVELIYKGELQDIISHPRTLYKTHAELNYAPVESDLGSDLGLDFNNTDDFGDMNEFNPLLPILNDNY
ncbi:hypothetical protein OAB00_04265 [Akkermansiaceae bacterium]|nr:hypothetical protein [Akkermansiaceae bacterium]